jgi:cell division initiation protein
MRLTPMDIRQQQFAVKLLRGFDPQEVDAFLDEMADSWDELVKENDLLKGQLGTVEDRLRALEAREKTLQETLITTQKMAEEFRESSKRAADIVLREAQLQAEKYLEEARQEQTKLTTDIAALKQLKRQTGEELLATLRMHQRLVEQRLVEGNAK